jgi:hypothetical protein
MITKYQKRKRVIHEIKIAIIKRLSNLNDKLDIVFI